MTVLCLHPLPAPSLFYSCWPWRTNICLSNNFYSAWLAADWYLRHTHTQKKDSQHLRAGHSSHPGWISGRWRSRAGHYVLFLLQSITIHLFQRSDRALIWRGIITALFKSWVSFILLFSFFFLNSTKLCVFNVLPTTVTSSVNLFVPPLASSSHHLLINDLHPTLPRLLSLPCLFPYCSISM